MISRSDWEPLPKPTLSPFARGYLSLCRFFTAAVWCVPALRVPLVHSLINHFRQKQVRRLTRNGLAPRLQDSTVGRHKAGELADRRKPRHAKDGVAMPLRSERFKVQARRLPAELGQHALVAAARGGDRKLKGMVLLTRVTGSATASASGTGVGQWPGIRGPGTV